MHETQHALSRNCNCVKQTFNTTHTSQGDSDVYQCCLNQPPLDCVEKLFFLSHSTPLHSTPLHSTPLTSTHLLSPPLLSLSLALSRSLSSFSSLTLLLSYSLTYSLTLLLSFSPLNLSHQRPSLLSSLPSLLSLPLRDTVSVLSNMRGQTLD